MNRRLAILAASAVGLILVSAGGAGAADQDAIRVERAMEEAEGRVVEATEELNALRDRIAEERTPLAEALDQLRREVADLRGEAERQQRVARETASEREDRVRRIADLDEACAFHRALLEEYRRAFETRHSAAEVQYLRPRLTQLDEALDAADATTEGFVGATGEVLALAASWNGEKLGGVLHPGPCLDPAGTEHEGRFAILGPVAFFASTDGDAVGQVINRMGSDMPSLFTPKDPASLDAIASLVGGATASVPFDPTGGDALKVVAQTASWQQHLRAGGVVMIPLLVIGLLAVLLTVRKAADLARVKTPAEEQVTQLTRLLEEGRLDAARELVDRLCQPFRAVLSAGIDYHGVPDEHLEEIFQERALAAVPSLDRHLGMLAVLGGVAPLLGLLGTVTGMIHTFELVTIFGTGDAKLLSGGISEALVTTETGLIIAVPILLVHAVLTRRVRTIVAALEQTVVGFMNRMHRVGSEGA